MLDNEEVEESPKDSFSSWNYRDSYEDSIVLVNSTAAKNFIPTDLHNLLSIPYKKAPTMKSKTK